MHAEVASEAPGTQERRRIGRPLRCRRCRRLDLNLCVGRRRPSSRFGRSGTILLVRPSDDEQQPDRARGPRLARRARDRGHKGKVRGGGF